MSIQCLICSKNFDKLITNSHLKSHGISTEQYKLKYGHDSLSSLSYRQELSNKNKGANNPNYNKKWNDEQKQKLSQTKTNSIPWNKGKKIGFTENQKKAIETREEKYKKNILTRSKKVVSIEEAKKISKSVSLYAQTHKEELKTRAIKSVETKRKNNYDFGKSMRNKNHSEDTKRKIALNSNKANDKRKNEAFNDRLSKIENSNLKLISENGIYLTLSCLVCNTIFPITRQYFTDSKYQQEICPKCFPIQINNRSKAELELFDFVKNLEPSAISNDRTVLSNRKEIDILVPHKNIAIEFNGLYWHSEKILLSMNKSKTSDFEKMNELLSLNYLYVGVYEDEWTHKKEIVKSRLRHILGKTQTKIFARKCIVKEIETKIASKFCEENHIQGYGKSNIKYGLFYNDELISVMTFGKNNLSRKSSNWEINRFCNKLNTTVVGGASKLFCTFIKKVNPDAVVSYADRRYSIGTLYNTLGLTFEKHTVPNYWYIPKGSIQRIHRFNLRKQKHESKNKTEKELRTSEGFLVIYDCGSSKWIWKKGN